MFIPSGPCFDCGAHVDDYADVPDENDDTAWDAQAKIHKPDCPWLVTRAGKRGSLGR